jgi:hypothetical protein
MTTLSSQWLTDGILDFEYKKYVVLAYLQHVRAEFKNQVLFPHLPQVKEHYQSSVKFKNSQRFLRACFPKDLTGIDPEKLRLQYREMYPETIQIEEINDILEFAIPRFSELMQEGQHRYDEVEAGLTIAPIGIMPLRTDEGYLFIHRTSSQETTIYQYQITLFDARRERIIQTHRLESIRKGLHTTFESLKVALTRRYTHLPNPATYIVESNQEYPLNDTLLPVAKQLMIRYMNKA